MNPDVARRIVPSPKRAGTAGLASGGGRVPALADGASASAPDPEGRPDSRSGGTPMSCPSSPTPTMAIAARIAVATAARVRHGCRSPIFA
jgi:hypothetical protein